MDFAVSSRPPNQDLMFLRLDLFLFLIHSVFRFIPNYISEVLSMRVASLEDAILLAAHLHKSQKDKADKHYILHPLRVMLNPILLTDEEHITGVLHDTVEDCSITIGQLKLLGYSDAIVEALSFITKLPEEEDDYDAFIARICGGPLIARKVKLADLYDNADFSRLPNPTEKDFKRHEKYLRAIALLEATL